MDIKQDISVKSIKIEKMIIHKTEKFKRILAIGDIHGCGRHLQRLLDVVKPTHEDLIVTMGDYIDRGPDSKDVIDTLLALHQDPEINIVSLCGNHDAMLLQCLDDTTTEEYYPSADGLDKETGKDWKIVSRQPPIQLWFGNQALSTHRSYCHPFSDHEARLGDLDANVRLCNPRLYRKTLRDLMAEIIPQEHINFLQLGCADACETDDFIFVHGGLCPDLPLADQPLFALHWKRFDKDCKPHVSGKKVICGHTPQPDLLVHDLGHTVCLDTGAYMAKGFLTCMNVMNGQCWQIDNDLQLIQLPVVHYGGKMPFVRISELPDGERQAFKSWLIGRSAPSPAGEEKDYCAWPNDYRQWWWRKR
ncbi:MAG: serine/threonine protein phosphatase [Deltaproteobacteria bacterium]|uniref:metallophosphoesterase family protein n=1 Tax=Hydrosulfovibrio ferrireducens TaxID=2934181 RepID=UPI00120787F6|nr:MAG: serine/threonine protein phosphatase [Deltaproteobacteria bacterium]